MERKISKQVKNQGLLKSVPGRTPMPSWTVRGDIREDEAGNDKVIEHISRARLRLGEDGAGNN